MGLSHLELHAVLAELTPLEHGLLNEVYQPTPVELILELRAQREQLYLLLSVKAGLARMHRLARRPPNPAKPFSFQMLCRKELSGRLEKIEQLPGERVVRLHFQGASQRILQAELLDKHGNLLLLDEQGLLLGSLLPGSPSRMLLPGQVPPPLPPPPPGRTIRDRFQARAPALSYQEAVAAFFRAEEEKLEFRQLQEQLSTGLRREIKRLLRLQEDLHGDLKRAEQADQHRKYGDLLQISLRQLKRGMTFIVLPDLFTEGQPPLEIPLDPQRDPLENMQRHYRLYRKYDASITRVLERLEQTEQTLIAYQKQLEQVERAEDVELLRSLGGTLHLPNRKQALPQRRVKADERLPYWRFRSRRGAEIWVGRSAQDNDALTFRKARGNDVWLHVRGRPGAHVVVPARPHAPDLETLLDAAVLALKYSGTAMGEKGDVAYTRVQYCRKVAGGPPGLVTYSQDKTLFVTLDEEILQQLQKLDHETQG